MVLSKIVLSYNQRVDECGQKELVNGHGGGKTLTAQGDFLGGTLTFRHQSCVLKEI